MGKQARDHVGQPKRPAPTVRNVARRVVRPAKAGAFSGRPTRQGHSQKPCRLEGREAGNRGAAAHRPGHRQDGGTSPGRHDRARPSGPERAAPQRPRPPPCGRRPPGSASTGWHGAPRWRGGRDSPVTRARTAPGEALLVPPRHRWSQVGRRTRDPGQSAEDERVAAGRVVATQRGHGRGATEPCGSAVL